VLGFAETARGSHVEPDGHTLQRIGLISKVLTGQLLASLASDDRLHLADPAQEFLPDAKLPVDGRCGRLALAAPRQASLSSAKPKIHSTF